MRITFALIIALSLTACGATYQSQRVVAGVTDDVKVRVIPVTSQSVLLANRSSYTPKSLPAVFQTTAGSGRGLIGSGAIPEPTYLEEARPSAIETRLPPNLSPQSYKIGVGDVVLLATPNGSSAEQLSGLVAAQNSRQGYTVQDDGAIAIPDVGRVAIAGITIELAEDVLFQHLVAAQIEPTFSLEVTEFNSQRVSLGGAVNAPGMRPITLTPLYLDEAIASAGGVTASDLEYTTVRLYRDGTLYQIPLEKLYSSNGLKRILLQSGDSIFVDETFKIDKASAYFEQQIKLASHRQSARSIALSQLQTEVSLRRAMLTEARSNYRSQVEFNAVDADYAYLTGEVKTQGRFALPLGHKATLADAIFEGAGGLATSTADPRHIYVLRGSDDPLEFDALTAWKLDAKNVTLLTLATRFELKPNDIIFVAEQNITRWHRTISQITPTILNLGASAVSG